MKEKIVAKLEEYIQRILDKPEITSEDYMTLRCRLEDIRMAEERSRFELENAESRRRMEAMMRAVASGMEADKYGM